MPGTPIHDEMRLRMRIDEEERLASLGEYAILDTGPDLRYERLSEMLRRGCEASWSTISFVDRDRQWFKAHNGCVTSETPRSVSFCSVSMLQNEPLIVEDARLDPRFCNNLLVIGEPFVRFYAGYPIFSREGFGLGSVCVCDTRPRVLLAPQLRLLATGRDWVQADLEVRRVSGKGAKSKGQPGGLLHPTDEQMRAHAQGRATRAWALVEEAIQRCNIKDGSRAARH